MTDDKLQDYLVSRLQKLEAENEELKTALQREKDNSAYARADRDSVREEFAHLAERLVNAETALDVEESIKADLIESLNKQEEELCLKNEIIKDLKDDLRAYQEVYSNFSAKRLQRLFEEDEGV